MARPTILTPELAATICESLAEGTSLRKICARDEMPTKSSVLLWVVKGHGGDKDYIWFSDQYAQARAANGQAHGDMVSDIAMQVFEDETINPQAAKVAIDGLKWAAERMAPKQYGNKTQLTGDGGGPIETKDLSDNDLARRLAFVLSSAAHSSE